MTSPLPRPLLIGLLVLASATPLKAAVSGSWTSLGPDGGPVSALASPVGSPNVIYAGVFGGVFKSVDGGATWSSASRGIDVPATVCSLTIDPLHPSTLYAGTCLGFSGLQRVRSGLFKSVDGGSTWKLTGLVASDVPIVAINPRFPQTLFAGTSRGFYQSSNGGETWRLISKGVLRASLPTALTIDPTSPRRMFGHFFQLSSFKTGLFKSLDGGSSWQPVQSDLQNIQTLAIDPRSPKTLYASPSFNASFALGGLYRSTNEGRSWTQCFLSADPILSLAFPPTQKTVVYAGGLPGLFRSLDGGATWTQLPNLPSNRVHSVLASATTLLVGVSDALLQQTGVFRSTDGGTSWTRSDQGLTASRITSLSVDPRDSNTLWTVANHNLFKSVDRGRTWNPLLPDLEPSNGYAERVAVSPVDGETIYVGTANGQILRSRDGGQTWTAGGDPDREPTILKADPRDAATVWAAGLDGRIHKSTDGGDTWLPLPGLAIGDIFFDLAFSPSSPATVYAGGNLDRQHPRAQVVRSLDSGTGWTAAQDGLLGSADVSLAVDPLHPETVYTVTDRDGDIYRTVDGGSTWSVINSAFHDRNVQLLAAAPSGALYAAVQFDNVYESEDGGLTCSPLGERPTPFSATSLAADPVDPCRVYAGTEDRGLLAFTKRGTAVCP
jgi:photosystem II stability/assembly factor-like uncharacterized protein